MGKNFQHTPCLLILCGLPATGKTTVALALSEKLGFPYVGTDYLREKMGLLGKYHAEAKKKVYDQMLQETRQAMEEGRSIIIDGTFHRNETRKPYLELNARIIWIVLVADEKTIAGRMQKKRLYSEADIEIYSKIKAEMDTYPEDSIELATDQMTLDEMIPFLIQKLPYDCQ